MTSSAPAAAIPVLMYHEVAKPEELQALGRVTQSNYVLTTDHFETQMNILRDSGCTPINLDQFTDWQEGKGTLPARPIVITFDDGFVGNERHALPVLTKFGFTATFYIVTERVGTPFMMSWNELRHLAGAGMSIESHTATHPHFSALGAEQTRRELADSVRSISSNLGRPVRHLSLPYGDSNPHVVPAARELGLRTVSTSVLGFNDRKTSPFELSRFAMTNRISDEVFGAIARSDSKRLSGMLRNARLKRALAKALGKRNYDRVVNFWYGVEGHDGAAAP